jgi:UDP-glucose:(heptosyl)LPS alpha-1,3-glucosyltransferase
MHLALWETRLKFALLLFKYFPFGGLQRDMLRIARELVKKGHQVEIFTISWDGELPESPIVAHVIPAKGLFNYVKYDRFIAETKRRIAQDGKFDLIVGFNRIPGLDAYFAADPCFIERAHEQRSWLYRLTPRYQWFAGCEQAIFTPAADTQILLLSDIEKRHFQKWYQTQDARFHFIPPFLPSERFVLQDKAEMRQYLREAFNFAPEDFVYLLVGSGFSMKGLDRAIHALASMPSELRQHVRLVAVGQDNPKPFMRMAKRLGVEANVTISRGRPDIPALMQGADVYVHPAYRENTGLVILEALACGLPTLVTSTCGYAYHVKDADAGQVAPEPYDQTIFNQMFLDMMQSPERQRWQGAGVAYAKAIMAANDGSAEARVLIEAAIHKRGKTSDVV